MFRETLFPRSFLVLALSIPLALILGYLVASPLTLKSIGVFGLVFMTLAFPLLIRWHGHLLIFSWFALLNAFFLPGQPGLWVVMSCLSLGMAVLNRTLRGDTVFLREPSIARPLILLAIVVTIHMVATGGIGGRAVGSELWGAKRYIGVFGAIIGYFAFTALRVPSDRVPLYVSVFFLSAATALLSHVAFVAGPKFYFLFSLFAPELAYGQAVTQDTMARLPGVFLASMAGIYVLLARYGITGIFDFSKPWRWFGLLLLMVTSLLGGYRSAVVLIALTIGVQFLFEGLYRTRLMLMLVAGVVIAGVGLVMFVDRLPLAVQRSLSFLPINVDHMVRGDAMSTLDWRFEMWKVVVPDIPKYLFLGKGYSFSGTDLILTQEAMMRGLYTSYEATLINGNYHNGLLTLIIPFGIFGLLAFVWFCWTAFRVLHNNYRFGDPTLKRINTFLLTFYVVRMIYYWIFYGQFDMDLMVFTGTVGLSLVINQGVRTAQDQIPAGAAEAEFTGSAPAGSDDNGEIAPAKA